MADTHALEIQLNKILLLITDSDTPAHTMKTQFFYPKLNLKGRFAQDYLLPFCEYVLNKEEAISRMQADIPGQNGEKKSPIDWDNLRKFTIKLKNLRQSKFRKLISASITSNAEEIDGLLHPYIADNEPMAPRPITSPLTPEELQQATGLKASWITDLEKYQLFHLAEYQTYLITILQNNNFSETVKYLLITAASRTWRTPEQAHTLCLGIENLLQLYSSATVEQFLTKINDSTAKWSISFVHALIRNILSIEKIETKKFSTAQEIIAILSDKRAVDWNEELHNLCARVYLIKNPEKDLEQVISDFKSLPFPLASEELITIKRIYQKVIADFSQNFLSQLDKDQLAQRLKQLAMVRIEPERFLIAYLALARQAIYLTKGYYPYNTQLFVMIALLTNTKGKGRLAQVKTGQGKSIIVATIAAYYGIQGKHIDIITTANNLAARDAKEMRSFFSLFNLKTATNCNNHQIAESYRAEIVYGTPFSFEFGYLLCQFSESDIRGKRRFDILLVDEVDSMFIDRSSHSTRLIYEKNIYARVAWIYPLLINYSKKNSNITVEQTLAQLKTEPAYKTSSLYIKNFIHANLTYWLYSVSLLPKKEKNVQYIVRNNKHILPVDFEHTGEVQEKTYYQSGLHQLLEVKHGIYPSTERVLSCQVSHLTYFNFYQTIFGLSGTLGSHIEREEIRNFYKIDSFGVPVHQRGKLVQQSFEFITEPNKWLNAIAQEAVTIAQQQRCVLILLEKIKDTYDIYPLLQEHSALLLNGEQELSTEAIINLSGRPGAITIATNIAGRGSDIKPSDEAEKKGGVHVILGFYPRNHRVEAQAIGRTARQGRQGSYSFIMNSQRENLPDHLIEKEDIKTFLNNQRQEKESQRAATRKKVYAPLGIALDKIVQQFCEFRVNFGKQHTKNDIAALNNRWMLWFSKQGKKVMDLEMNANALAAESFIHSIALEFKAFIEKIQQDAQRGKLLQYPEDFLARASEHREQKQYAAAAKLCKKALSLDSGYTEASYILGTVYEEKINEATNAHNAFRSAAASAQTNIKLCPKIFKEWVLLAAAHNKLGDFIKMEECLQQCEVLVSDIQKAEEIKRMSQLLHQYGFYSLAEKCCQRILAMNPHSDALINLYINIGLEYSEKENYNQAIEYTQKALALDPTHCTALNNLGLYYMNLKNYNAAHQALNQTLHYKPDYETPKINLATLHIEVGYSLGEQKKYSAAITITQKALALQPTNATALNNIGAYYIQLKDYHSAHRFLTQALHYKPEFELTRDNLRKVFINLGHAASEQGDYRNAIGYTQQALALNPTHHIAHTNMGCYYMKLGDPHTAYQALSLALQYKPDYQPAKNNLDICMQEMRRRSFAR